MSPRFKSTRVERRLYKSKRMMKPCYVKSKRHGNRSMTRLRRKTTRRRLNFKQRIEEIQDKFTRLVMVLLKENYSNALSTDTTTEFHREKFTFSLLGG